MWYAALKGRIDRISFERALLAGENMDSNAPPLNTSHYSEMVSAHPALRCVHAQSTVTTPPRPVPASYHPGTRLGAYIKALAGNVPALPEIPSAAGARVGAINQLLPLMPPFLVCQVTGHYQRGEGVFTRISGAASEAGAR